MRPSPFYKLQNLSKGFNPTVKLYSQTGNFFCSATVVDIYHAITAAHCVLDLFGDLDTSTITLISSYDEIIGSAHVEALNTYKDVAILRGDFSKVRSAYADFIGGTTISLYDELVSCGYPSGQSELYCTSMIFFGNSNFMIKGMGMPLVKGMSGGPLFHNGVLIGVNSSVLDEGNSFGNIIGIQTMAIQ